MSDQSKIVWMQYTKRAPFDDLARACGIMPLTARLFVNRGIRTAEEIDACLHPALGQLQDPSGIPEMRAAADLILKKIGERARIRIVGDYDIDGVTSTCILLTALRKLGADADYYIPHRIRDGYGISRRIIDTAHADGIDTIITVDNGIRASDEVAAAKRYGMTVIVTDHHDVPADGNGQEIVPAADVVIDPKMRDSAFSCKEPCGAVVAWKLTRLLFEKSGDPGLRDAWKGMLDLAAFGTVGDVVPLTGENRLIASLGLRAIARTENLGLRKLLEHTHVNPEHITGYTLGFVLGPCVNAAGRLASADLAERLLLEKEPAKADDLAQQLCDLNARRKDMTRVQTQLATEIVNEKYAADKVLVVFLPECHESLAGIIAGKLREAYNRPAFVLTNGQNSVKGSGRSIDAYNMSGKLGEVSDLLIRFGGHKLAAGLSLARENVDAFRAAVNERCGLTDEDLIPKVWVDAQLPFHYVNAAFLDELDMLEPFGTGFDRPCFAELRLPIRSVNVGQKGNSVNMMLQDGDGSVFRAFLFTDGEAFERERAGRQTIDIIYQPEFNDWSQSIEARILNYKFR